MPRLQYYLGITRFSCSTLVRSLHNLRQHAHDHAELFVQHFQVIALDQIFMYHGQNEASKHPQNPHVSSQSLALCNCIKWHKSSHLFSTKFLDKVDSRKTKSSKLSHCCHHSLILPCQIHHLVPSFLSVMLLNRTCLLQCLQRQSQQSTRSDISIAFFFIGVLFILHLLPSFENLTPSQGLICPYIPVAPSFSYCDRHSPNILLSPLFCRLLHIF